MKADSSAFYMDNDTQSDARFGSAREADGLSSGELGVPKRRTSQRGKFELLSG
jgi:hypothetical protein